MGRRQKELNNNFPQTLFNKIYKTTQIIVGQTLLLYLQTFEIL